MKGETLSVSLSPSSEPSSPPGIPESESGISFSSELHPEEKDNKNIRKKDMYTIL
jgi:hypothetical protein